MTLEEVLTKELFVEYITDDDYCFLCGNPMSKEKRKEAIDILAQAIREHIRKKLPKEKDEAPEIFFPVAKHYIQGYNQAIEDIERSLGV